MKHCGRAACKADLSGMRSDAEWCSKACAQRVWRGEKRYTAGTSGSSGLQVSYRKSVDVLAATLVVTNERPGYVTQAAARRAAGRLMREALSDRQRARLDERDG